MRHGFAISIQPFAHEDDERDEDSLDRKPHFASDGEPDDGKELDLRIRLAASELAYLRALKSGDKGLAAKHRKEAERCDRELTKRRGNDDKGGEEDDSAE